MITLTFLIFNRVVRRNVHLGGEEEREKAIGGTSKEILTKPQIGLGEGVSEDDRRLGAGL